ARVGTPAGAARQTARHGRRARRRSVSLPACAVIVIAALVAGYAIGRVARPTTGTGAASRVSTSPGSGRTATAVSGPAPLEGPDLPPLQASFEGTQFPSSLGVAPVRILGGFWEVFSGRARPVAGHLPPLDPTRPYTVSQVPSFVVDPGRPTALVQVTLATPAPWVGVIAHYVDERNYWMAVMNPSATGIALYRVKAGAPPKQFGSIKVPVKAGMAIGIFMTGDQITVALDGNPVTLTTFFGARRSISAGGVTGNGVGVISGGGGAQVDDLRYA
ncbi:MAG: hypothetical protein JWN46_2959, partial [Acidimicrobiales bacterium]|nr:hypothetical protein [Acidimicrobiales bacterium]